jgi:probable blue pigment (indigoidine) exporter
VETGSVDRRSNLVATGLLAASVVIWGCTPRMTAVGGPHADPLTLTSLRAAPTAVVLLLALPLLRYSLPRGRAAWAWTAVRGLLMVTVFLAGFTEAVIRSGPGTAVVLGSTAPFFVVILGRIFLGERATVQAVSGLLLGFVGVILVVWSQLDSHGKALDMALGMVLALGAALGWGAGTLVVKELLTRHPDVDLVGLTTGQYLVGGVVLLVLSFGTEGAGSADWGSGDLWLSVAFISIVGSAIATVAYFGALRRISATQVVAWSLLSPVVAVLLEILLGHTPRPVTLIGMAVTIAGVGIVSCAPEPGRAMPVSPALAGSTDAPPRG